MAAQAIKIGDTLLRIREIAWIKVRRLSALELTTLWFLVGSGVLFAGLVAWAKGSLWNLESLLGFLPIRFGLALRGEYRVASTGDTDETYEDREARAHLAEVARTLVGEVPGVLEYRSPGKDYHYILQPEKLAWVRPWSSLDFSPLVLTLVFGIYWLVAPRPVDVGSIPILQDLRLLQFPAHGTAPALLATALVLAGSLLAVVASVKRGVVVATVGGLQDNLPLRREHRLRLYQELMGSALEPDSRADGEPPAGETGP